MGSFDMNASFSRMPIKSGMPIVVIPCLKRVCGGSESLMPLGYPVVGEYLDYGGYLENIQESEITKTYCEFFGIPDFGEVIKFIYSMSIHGDYQDGLRNRRFGKSVDPKFDKYLEILDRLRATSGITPKTYEEIVREEDQRLSRILEKNSDIGKSRIEKVRSEFISYEQSEAQEHQRILDTYELALFYEHLGVWKAITGMSDIDDSGNPCEYYEPTDRAIKEYLYSCPDDQNFMIITKDLSCPDQELEIKRLFRNFVVEGKTFRFTETSIEGQDCCPWMWYRVGSEIRKIWKEHLEYYGGVTLPNEDN